MQNIMLKCTNCGAVNRVIRKKLHATPKCGRCSSQIKIHDYPVNITSGSYSDHVLSEPGIVLLDFWSPSCTHCMNLNPVLNEISREYSGLIKIVKADVDNEPELASRFGITGIPALFLFRGGKRIDSLVGVFPKHEIIKWIKSSGGLEL